MSKKDSGEGVTASVMRDPVTKSAIKHSGKDPSPSRVAATKAEQSETKLRTEGQRETSWRWESTQMWLALLFCSGFMAGHLAVVGSLSYLLVMKWEFLSDQSTLAVLVALLATSLGAIASLAAGVVATYFQRTNSHKVGGVEKGHEGR